MICTYDMFFGLNGKETRKKGLEICSFDGPAKAMELCKLHPRSMILFLLCWHVMNVMTL